MLFSSPLFLFLFLPAFLLLFYLLPKRMADCFLFIASFLFYWWGETIFAWVAFGMTLFDYVLCQYIEDYRQENLGRQLLIIGIIVNVGCLFYFKYTNFFFDNFDLLFQKFGIKLGAIGKIALPIGVSFIVFEKITYLVDVYKGKCKPAKNLIGYLNYIFLFPKLLAGPIIKYNDIELQLGKHNYTFDDILFGFRRFLQGLAKKVLIADTIAEFVDVVFEIPTSELGRNYAWLGLLGFMLQGYFDFSGYSDMAIGLGRMLGFRIRENFNYPFIATSFTDFWRRWHISMTSWFKEYLYIPLGGNQVSRIKIYLNLWLVFLISGIWHGADWTFVIWGAYNGIFLMMDRLFWLQWSEKLPKEFCTVITLFLVMMGFLLIRSPDFTHTLEYLKVLFLNRVDNAKYIDITLNIEAALWIGILLGLGPRVIKNYELIANRFQVVFYYEAIYSFLISLFALFAISKAMGVTFNPFLYFRF